MKQALAQAERFADLGVSWFEEPVSSDDLEGLALLRSRAPATMDIAAGEYGYDPFYFRRMLEAPSVDVLQADATRCGGVSGFLRVAALCEARPAPLSAHCAPSIHAHLGCIAPEVIHLEYFHDHARIERMLFEGALRRAADISSPTAAAPAWVSSSKKPTRASIRFLAAIVARKRRATRDIVLTTRAEFSRKERTP